MNFVLPVISSNLEVNNFSRDYVQAQRLNGQGTGKTSAINLTRPISAITIGSDGYYTWVPASQPRWGYDPVTKQPRGWYIGNTITTNVLLYSEDFSQSYWEKNQITVTSNTSFVSPSGNFSSYELNEGTSTGQHVLSALTNYQPITAYANFYTISIFARAGTCDLLQIIFDNDNWVFGPDRWATFNLANGTVANNPANLEAYINPAGNGWYKLMLVSPMSATNSNLQFINTGVRFAMCTTSNSNVRAPSYTGTSRNIYLWGAHYYRGNTAEYTPTYGLSAALPPGLGFTNGAGDWTGSSFDSTIYQNTSAGTLFIEFIQHGRQPGGLASLWSFASDSNTNVVGFGSSDGVVNIGARMILRNTNLYVTNTNFTPFTVCKAAFAWQPGSQAVAVNGTIVNTNNLTTAIVDNAGNKLGSPTLASYFISSIRLGWYRKLRYYPYRLPNQVLIGLTR